MHFLLIMIFVALFAATPAALGELALDEPEAEKGESVSGWQRDWAVEDGFSLSLDAEGFDFPTAIAFVPEPGSRPKDPLYFVTELRGRIKVVTNDRTVYTFAEGFLRTGFGEDLNNRTESGLAGICLEPSRGYVFATFAYQDGPVLRNNIIRFKTEPKTFALKAKSQRAFTEVFAPYESGISHQIGGCAIDDGLLYVGVGDGWNSHLGAQQLDTFQGKLIRMTLDGRPAPGNPFYENDDIGEAANYIWAYGFRNPFSLDVVDGQVLVAENGLHMDRFLRARRGKNYLWNGSDESIATNADFVFTNAIGPVQAAYHKRTAPDFPHRFADQLYLALSGGRSRGIMRVPWDTETQAMRGVPQPFVEYAGDGDYPVTGLAFGPDGLYFAPILPVRNDQGAVLKIAYAPADAHPVTLADPESLDAATADRDAIIDFMYMKGCFGCHQVAGARMETGGTKGPVLGDRAMVERIQRQVDSRAYLEQLQQLDARDQAPFDRYAGARDEIAAAQGLDRVRVWMTYHILEPRFDGPFTGMPNLGLRRAEAEAITRFLLGETGFVERLKAWLPEDQRQRLAIAFGAGVVIGLPTGVALWRLAWRGFRRRQRS